MGVTLAAEAAGLAWRQRQIERPTPTPVAVSTPAPVTAGAATTTTFGSPITALPAESTTLPAPTPAAAVTIGAPVVSGETVTYRLAAGTAVTLSFSGPCWVQARTPGPGGTVVFEQILAAGATRRFDAPVWLRLGDPAEVRASVAGFPLQMPARVPGNLVIGPS